MSKFQQRHYVAIAKVIAEVKTRTLECEPAYKIGAKIGADRYAGADAVDYLEYKLTKLFESDNEKFNAGRFAAACVPEGK